MDKAYLVREVKSFLMDEDGVGVIISRRPRRLNSIWMRMRFVLT